VFQRVSRSHMIQMERKPQFEIFLHLSACGLAPHMCDSLEWWQILARILNSWGNCILQKTAQGCAHTLLSCAKQQITVNFSLLLLDVMISADECDHN
jgi:hypothetical protein